MKIRLLLHSVGSSNTPIHFMLQKQDLRAGPDRLMQSGLAINAPFSSYYGNQNNANNLAFPIWTGHKSDHSQEVSTCRTLHLDCNLFNSLIFWIPFFFLSKF